MPPFTVQPLASLASKRFLQGSHHQSLSRTFRAASNVRFPRSPLPAPRLNPYLAIQKALFTTSRAFAIEGKTFGKQFKDENEKRRHEKLKPDPENVTTTSTTRPILDMGPSPESALVDKDPDVLKGVKSELHAVRETFALREVPKEVYWFGMGGLVPYVVTSASTMYLAWDLEYMRTNGMGYLVSKETAESLLHLLEPTQVAYGAIILSFLGAIHWGLEFAKFGGSHPYRRYTLGILAPALAWPTVLLPLDYALVVQFVGFTGIYFADAQATMLGWAPKWYTTYRFILTFIVGVCIVTTLIGRGKIGDDVTPVQQAHAHLEDLRYHQRRQQERSDHEKARRMEAEDRAVQKSRENKEEKGDEVPSDPAKKVSQGKEGKQGVYSDELQLKEGRESTKSGPGQIPEPSAEKKVIKNPKEEGPGVASSKGRD